MKKFSTNTQWEKEFAYSRAVREGKRIFVSGTTAVDEEGEIKYPGDAYAQSIFIFKKIENALRNLEGSLKDVVRTRMFVTSMLDAAKVGQAHGEVFKGIEPAATMVEVSNLIRKELVVEIEVDAIVS